MHIYIYIYGKNNNNYSRVPRAAGGVEKEWFQQSASTHPGAGEKETLNINVVGKTEKTKRILPHRQTFKKHTNDVQTQVMLASDPSKKYC